jgi:hypothetical protein
LGALTQQQKMQSIFFKKDCFLLKKDYFWGKMTKQKIDLVAYCETFLNGGEIIVGEI